MLFCNKFLFTLLSCVLLHSCLLNAQIKENLRVTINNQTDFRKLSRDYFGDPNLWTYILKYNNINDLSSTKAGIQIIIPQKKVKELLELFDSAGKYIQDAVKAGAKILAAEQLENSVDEYNNAVKSKEILDFDSSREYLVEAIGLAKKAFNQTMEIREKTIDAIISYKKGTVQKMFPSILNWEDVELYDNLKENDWARTLSLSLANITFNDLSQIKLYENSEAEIQRSRVDVIGNKTDTKIKLKKGNAYAILLNNPKKKFGLDIPGVTTKINSKYFWVEKNKSDAKLANYNGEITLGVKDSNVIVHKDQGSVIPDGGYPSKPKNLIPAPLIIFPKDFSSVSDNNLNFEWEKMPGVSNYSLEISTSAVFKIVDKSYTNITLNSFKITGIKPGVYYWRVCSVDDLGLPGPFSEIRSIIILKDTAKPFLLIYSPSDNSIIRSTKLTVSGKTNSGCIVSVNNQNVETDNYGNFGLNIILNEGENIIDFKSTDPAGGISIIRRNVYVETSPEIKVSDLIYGELTNGSDYYSDKNLLKLNLSTRPLSRIEIKSIKSRENYTSYSDTLGKCEFVIPINYFNERFLLTVQSPAGFRKEIGFNLYKKNREMEIILDSSINSFTNRREIVIKGKAFGAKELFINNVNVPINGKGEFSSLQQLKGFENNFTIKANYPDGSFGITARKIIFDDNPPKLLSSELKLIGDNLYLLIVKAEDESSLKKTAEAELNIEGKFITETLPFISAVHYYELKFYSTGESIPRIKSVTLEDELNNKKTYIMQNKKIGNH